MHSAYRPTNPGQSHRRILRPRLTCARSKNSSYTFASFGPGRQVGDHPNLAGVNSYLKGATQSRVGEDGPARPILRNSEIGSDELSERFFVAPARKRVGFAGGGPARGHELAHRPELRLRACCGAPPEPAR